ncbi:helix-turn-helix domain-containing protein [Vitreoscilla massiliensis]|uniref:Helix-turn-helix domain-containing protein n=1 Tax=Vitreoscilla massiliensis TaxID=1689272 RepID=A0ABY4E3M9_9NEIS|nr:helix-turn-helix transcriptional regulator [Vitreoscilla massiliensis]UOO90104.1 helix-turn-helix domain-containing protein [Vitreoscilla massiliensis]
MIKVKNYSGYELIQLRQTLKMNQTEFWSAVNVTQPGGSRYESGHTAPDQVLILIELVHELNLDLSTSAKRSKLSVK